MTDKIDYDQLVDGYEYQIWHKIKFVGIYRLYYASALRAVFLHIDDQAHLEIRYSEWDRGDYTFYRSLTTVRTMSVAKEYGVYCGRCKEFFPDAEKVVGFRCWSCRKGPYR